jgi:hypothetical protein
MGMCQELTELHEPWIIRALPALDRFQHLGRQQLL